MKEGVLSGVKVSIIILTKNAGNGFGQLMEAISNQKFNGNFEISMVDSGSVDTTLQTAEKYNVLLINSSTDLRYRS